MNRSIAVVVLALFVTACAPGFDATPDPTTTTRPASIDQAAADLAAARAAWASVGSADYTYEFHNDCGECDPAARSPRRIAVLDGKVLTVDDGDGLPTVEEVFGDIEHAITAGRDVEVVYDATTGYPTDVQIDMDQRPVDGGTHWIFEELTALNPIGSTAELREARRLWESQQLDDYQFLMRVECDCLEDGTFDVKVVDDRVFEVVRLDHPAGPSNVTPVTISRTFDDLEEWFTDTQTLVDEGILEVDVRVDPIMGYPRWVYLRAQNIDNAAADLFTAVVTMDLVAAFDPGDSPTVPDDGDLASLRQARNLWESRDTKNYSYTLTIHCM
ncbi:MAG: DUF6174 domain-containing protein, partial [Acidimicrobiia bacterium]|nr:DUF6174 domain-containing protein [Acidimicrobiia bacterium]